MVTPRMLPPFSPPEGETPSTVPFEVAMPEPRSADCYGVDDGYKSPRHMLDTAERDALVDKVSRLHGVFEQYIYIYSVSKVVNCKQVVVCCI